MKILKSNLECLLIMTNMQLQDKGHNSENNIFELCPFLTKYFKYNDGPWQMRVGKACDALVCFKVLHKKLLLNHCPAGPESYQAFIKKMKIYLKSLTWTIIWILEEAIQLAYGTSVDSTRAPVRHPRSSFTRKAGKSICNLCTIGAM